MSRVLMVTFWKRLERAVEITHSISACMKVLLGLIAYQG